MMKQKKQDLEEAKKSYKVSEITYANKLIDIMARKEFEVVEKLCTYMFAQANYFHEGYEALSKLEQTLRQMMNTLVNTQNDYLEKKNQFNLLEIINKRRGESVNGYNNQIKQGFVFLKKKLSWARRWFVVTTGHLFVYKGWKVTTLQFLSYYFHLSC